jgi:acetoin utilization deacetylase AcuC-like enzyme
MPKTIFEEMQRAKLEAEIHETLTQASLNQEDCDKLLEYQIKLQHYLEQDISDRIKRAINKALTAIKSLNDIIDMDVSPAPQEYLIQIPSTEDLGHMKRMPAGSDEDQQQRLTHMAELIESNESLPITSTEAVELDENWVNLFNTIDKGNKAETSRLLERMAHKKDPLLQLILSVHPLEYIQSLVQDCITARAKGFKRLEDDIVLTPKTFELLIKDLATTLHHSSPLYFSFGLPSHHAYSGRGSGFCILNKIAILLSNAESKCSTPTKYVIIGTDVNRDNGLCQVLRDSASHLDITHVDVFDSRVYPRDNFDIINGEFPAKTRAKAREIREDIIEWPHGHYKYVAVDLALTRARPKAGIHPAITFAVTQIQERIAEARAAKQQAMLFLPTGWDSHQDETAECGKLLDGERLMTKAEAQKQRFTNKDLEYFYKQVIRQYKENKEVIAGIYWGLEGGYDRGLYEQQILLLLRTIQSQLIKEPEHASAFAP